MSIVSPYEWGRMHQRARLGRLAVSALAKMTCFVENPCVVAFALVRFDARLNIVFRMGTCPATWVLFVPWSAFIRLGCSKRRREHMRISAAAAQVTAGGGLHVIK